VLQLKSAFWHIVRLAPLFYPCNVVLNLHS
jgi:hypothetical protein